MRIGELSKITGVSIPTIRLYEREGLIDPASRTEGRFREFTPQQERRLNFIKRVRNLGFSLADVKALLMLSNGVDDSISSEFIDHVRDEISDRQHDLKALEKSLRKMIVGALPASELDRTFTTR
ncbi:MAG: MerR family transcriptional regulator [Sphingopyxis sp.]|nr:MerR family transcriptional regulator [Sphingopyxis sp.]